MRFWMWLMLVMGLLACAKKADVDSYDMAEADFEDFALDEEPSFAREESRSRAPRARRAPAPSSAGVAGRMSMADSARPEPEPAVAKDREPVAERMIAYEASTTLRVARIRPAVDAITATVEGLGGFVERVDGARLVVRVPVARFQDGLEAVQSHGDIVDERIFASDVTEAFQDVQLRLDTARATRERLVELLALTEDENEKLMLIREIERLTDQIDQMTAQSTTLRRLADLSRITVRLVEREALAHQGARDSAPFDWIRQISPFGADVVRQGGFVKLDVPEGMVGLDQWREYAAEAPDGSRIWSGKLDTAVQADSAFWIGAVEERLADDFAMAEVSSLGEFAVITFTSRDDTPYTWLVAVRASGRHLEVVEAFLSDPTQAERFLPGVKAVIAARGGAA